MKQKTYTYGITFFTTGEMYMDIKRLSDQLKIGVSDFLRGMINEYLTKNADVKVHDQPQMPKDHMEEDLEKIVQHEELTPKVEDTRDGLL